MAIAEILERDQKRPVLGDHVDDFEAVLWREIERGPDGVSAIRVAQAVAEAVVRNYTISPCIQNYFVRRGVIDHVMEMLEPSEENNE